jgi:hypothetical protein
MVQGGSFLKALQSVLASDQAAGRIGSGSAAKATELLARSAETSEAETLALTILFGMPSLMSLCRPAARRRARLALDRERCNMNK